MKSIYVWELTLENFAAHPVWEQKVEDDWDWDNFDPLDQFLPYGGESPVDVASFDRCLVAARFTLADGTVLPGYFVPDTSEYTPSYFFAVIFTAEGPVHSWFTSPRQGGIYQPTPEELASNYAKLGRAAAAVFPIHFESSVPLINGPTGGTLHGFYYDDENNVERFAA